MVYHSWQRQGDVAYAQTPNAPAVCIGPNFSQCFPELTTTLQETELQIC